MICSPALRAISNDNTIFKKKGKINENVMVIFRFLSEWFGQVSDMASVTE